MADNYGRAALDEVSKLKNGVEVVTYGNEYSVLSFGVKGDGITNDLAAFRRAVSEVPEGSSLRVPLGTFVFNEALVVNRRVNIIGAGKPKFDGDVLVGGSVILGGGFVVTASNVEIRDVGVINLTAANGFVVRGTNSDVTFDNCSAQARDHGFIVEENGGSIERTRFSNCDSYQGVHGFVSKSKLTTIDNCYAYKSTTNGYVVSSDNNNLEKAISNGSGTSITNSVADQCTLGFTIHARDFQDATNASGIKLENVTLDGCSAIDCTVGYNIGNVSDVNSKLEVAPNLIRLQNCYETGSKSTDAVRVNRVSNANINISCASGKNILYSPSTCSQVSLDTKNIGGQSAFFKVETLALNSTTPSVSSGRKIFRTENTQNTNITDFTGGKLGQEIEVIISEDFTQITNSGSAKFSLIHTGGLKGKGTRAKFIYDGSLWVEVSGMTTGKPAAKNIKTNGVVDATTASIHDLQSDGGDTTPITFVGKNPDSPIITLLFRSTVGGSPINISLGAGIMAPDDFPTTASFEKRVVAQFVYIDNISKWANIGWQIINS